MNTTIKLAKLENAQACLDCIRQSELWEAYFAERLSNLEMIENRIKQQKVHISINDESEIVGFMGISENGCFGRFHYLSILAVNSKYRGLGIGTKLINRFEELGFAKENKVFLLVSGFNTRAESLYKKLGYTKIGVVPDLFKTTVDEVFYYKPRP